MYSKSNFYLTLLIITIPLYVQADIKKYDYRDIYLDPQSFEKSVLQSRQMMVKWCAMETEDCARLHSILVELAIIVELAEEVASNITIGAVDCAKHWQFCAVKNITDYPNLMLIKQQGKRFKMMYNPYFDLFRLMQLLKLPDLREKSEFRVARVQVYCPRQQVLSLSPADFSTIISEGIFLIKFFESSCFTCRMISSRWKSLANRMNNENAKVCIAEFECVEGRNLFMCMSFGMTKVPSVMWFEYGKMIRKYAGQYTTSDLEHFALEMIRLNGSYKAATPSKLDYNNASPSVFTVQIHLVLLIGYVLTIL